LPPWLLVIGVVMMCVAAEFVAESIIHDEL